MNQALAMLAEAAERILDRPITDRESEAFQTYLDLVLRWQRVQRLVGSSDPGWIVENLFLDSLLFLRVLPSTDVPTADLGSGAGVPGIPLKIVRPGLPLALIESRERRASFLSTVVRDLRLRDVRVVSQRAEDLAETSPGHFGSVVMRCAGDHAAVVPPARRLVRPGGKVVVAGPPSRRPLGTGRWIEVPGVKPGTTRLFAIYEAAGTDP